LKVTYTEEAVADIVEAITYLNESRRRSETRRGHCAMHRPFGGSGV